MTTTHHRGTNHTIYPTALGQRGQWESCTCDGGLTDINVTPLHIILPQNSHHQSIEHERRSTAPTTMVEEHLTFAPDQQLTTTQSNFHPQQSDQDRTTLETEAASHLTPPYYNVTRDSEQVSFFKSDDADSAD